MDPDERTPEIYLKILRNLSTFCGIIKNQSSLKVASAYLEALEESLKMYIRKSEEYKIPVFSLIDAEREWLNNMLDELCTKLVENDEGTKPVKGAGTFGTLFRRK